MTLGIVFLNVGNADSIVLLPTNTSAVIIDIPQKRQLETWLKSTGVTNIDCIYFTHSHKDHLPSLVALQTFISSWREAKGIDAIQRLCVPTDAIRNAFRLIQGEELSKSQRDVLQSSLDKLLIEAV
jgi:ribonuclease BN (tRNA processing enzyme)